MNYAKATSHELTLSHMPCRGPDCGNAGKRPSIESAWLWCKLGRHRKHSFDVHHMTTSLPLTFPHPVEHVIWCDSCDYKRYKAEENGVK